MTLVLGALFQVVSQGSLLTLLYLQRNNFLLAKMSAFEDEFEAIPPVSEVDPAAEFLAKEQEELGDIGEDLGLGAAPQDFSAAADENFGGNNEDEVSRNLHPFSKKNIFIGTIYFKNENNEVVMIQRNVF